MRNLKRALSLALASVMLLGMMVVGTSAASYPDVDAADNLEAIKVMQIVGVMEGDDNGNFNPDKNVTRNEMAVVMVNLMDLNIKDYKGTAPFTDVPAWAEPYVAACYANKIVSGAGEGLYNGDATVTAAEAALMMQKALGYFQYQSDFGQDWMVATIKQASKIELFKGISSNAKTPLTRNDVAQLALNTLKSTMVDAYGADGVKVEGDGFTVTTGSTIQYNPITVTDNGVGSNPSNYAGTSAGDEGLGTKQLLEERFEYKLETRTGVTADEFSTPGYTWTYDNDETVFVPETPVAVFNGKVGAADVAKALKGYKITTVAIENYTNVSSATYTIIKDNGEDSATGTVTPSGSQTMADAINDELANGKLVSFYDTNDDKVIDVITRITYTLDTVAVTEGKTNNSTWVQYAVTGENGKVWTNAANDETDSVVVVGDVKDKDYVTYVVASNSEADEMLYIYATDSFVGAQSAKTSSTITVSGTKYKVALGVSTVSIGGFANSNDEANYYVDQFGYVVKTDAIAAETKYAIVDKIAVVGATGTGGNQTVEAILAFADGTTKTVNVSKINDIKAKDITDATAAVTTNSSKVVTALSVSSTKTNNNAICGVPVTYVEKDGKYEITYLNLKASLSGATAKASIFDQYAVSASSDAARPVAVKVTEKGMPTVMGYGKTDGGSASASVVANNNTVYLVKTMSGTDEKFSSYSGYKNVPSITITGGTEASGANDAHAYVSYALDEDSKVAFIYIDATDTRAAAGDTETGDILYISSTTKTESLVGDDTIYELTGIVNGVAGVTVKSENSTMFDSLTKGELYELTTDNDGYVTAKSLIDTYNFSEAYNRHTAISASAEAEDGVMIIDSVPYTYDGTEKVIVLDEHEIVGGTIASAKAGDTVYIKVVDRNATDSDKYAIEIIYIVKA